MALLALLTPCKSLPGRLEAQLLGEHDLASAASWERLTWLVRERPVSGAIVDAQSLCDRSGVPFEHAFSRVDSLRRGFPSVGLLVLCRPRVQGEFLFRLGSDVSGPLRLFQESDPPPRLLTEVGHTLESSASRQVLAGLAPHVRGGDLETIRRVVGGLHFRWSAERFAASTGMTRPALSHRLKHRGLVSVGRLLLWSRLLHAGVWLCEPGRTADSVGRQLEYSSGAAFRRALKVHTGATPTQVIARGGLPFVLSSFVGVCRDVHDRVLLRAS